MKRLITAGLAAAALFALAGCSEHYRPVTNSKLVIVTDADGSVDARNLRVACAEAGFTAPVRTVGRFKDGDNAVVECR